MNWKFLEKLHTENTQQPLDACERYFSNCNFELTHGTIFFLTNTMKM